MSVIPTVWVTEALGLGRGSWSCCWAKAPAASSSPAAERVASLFMCSSFCGDRNLSASPFDPALEVAHHQVGEEAHVVGPVVQGRDVAVALAAGVEEEFAVEAVDLLQGLQAVGGEAGADHVQAADAGLRHALDGAV